MLRLLISYGRETGSDICTQTEREVKPRFTTRLVKCRTDQGRGESCVQSPSVPKHAHLHPPHWDQAGLPLVVVKPRVNRLIGYSALSVFFASAFASAPAL